MSVFRIKNKNREAKPSETQKKVPMDIGLPSLGKPKKSNKLATIIAFLGFILSIGGLGLYISESRMGQKEEGKQYFLTLSILDSAKQPLPGATLKSQQRVIGTTNAAGQWLKTFAIVAGSEYPITVEGTDNQGRAETKHVKLVFPHWTKTSSVMNRVIRLDTLKNSVPDSSALSTPSAGISSPNEEGKTASTEGIVNAPQENKPAEIAKNDVVQPKVALPAAPNAGTEAPQIAISSSNANQGTPASQVTPEKAISNKLTPDNQGKIPAVNSQEKSEQKETQAITSKEPPLLPKNLASIWFRTEGSSSASPLTRGQSLESIKEKLQMRAKSLGFTLDEKANLTLSLKNLDGKLGSEAQDVIQVEVRLGNKPMETYLRNYQEDALTTARLILWRARLSLPVAYQIKKMGDRFTALQPLEGPSLWHLSEGTNLTDESGARGVVGEEKPKALTVSVSGAPRFCLSAAVCRAQIIPGEVNQKGWSKRTLTVLGASGRKLMIFAAGNPAVESKGEFSYEGQDNGFTVFTVLEEGKIIYRNALHNNLYQQTILTLPVASISRR
ncbi:MAG: hypothetical protein WCI18_12165 [Pseudomonadota bacterium]